LNFYDSTNRSTIWRFDRRYKRKKLYFYDSMIRWFEFRFKKNKKLIFMIRRIDRRFDDSIVVIKEKKLYFYDSMIRRFDRRFERKKIYIFMIRWFDRWFDDSIDDSTIRSMIRRFDRIFKSKNNSKFILVDSSIESSNRLLKMYCL
jgi:hypothetical protein